MRIDSSGLEILVPFVQQLGFLAQNDRGTRFSEEEKDSCANQTSNDDLHVKYPTPGGILGDKATNQGPQSGPEQGSARKTCHGRISVVRLIHIGHDPSHHG